MAGPSSGGVAGNDDLLRIPQIPPMPTKFSIKGYASGVNASDAIIALTIPKSGRLVAVQALIRAAVSGAITENVQYEVSTQSASQFTTNDAQGCIASFAAVAPAATAGTQAAVNLLLGGFNWQFDAGSKLYVHRTTAVPFATSLLTINCFFE